MIRELYGRHRRLIGFAVSAFALGLTMMYLVNPDVAAALAILGGWTGTVAFWAATNWERVEIIGGRIIGLVGRASSRAERVGISAEMQGQINGARKRLQDELEGALPHPVRVKFVRQPDDLAALHDGEVVIALSNHKKRAENLARATLAYTRADLIRPARSYVDADVMRSVDHSVAKRILYESDRDALDFFVGSIWTDELAVNPSLQDTAHQIEMIERHGLLTRILLSEFLELGRRLYPEFPPPGIFEATRGLVSHLYRIVTKKADEDLGELLMFRSGLLSVGVVLVADRRMADRAGVRPYVWRCLQDIRQGCDAVYLLARGSNVTLISDVLDGLRGNGRVLDVGEIHQFAVPTATGPVQVALARVLGDQRGYRTGRYIQSQPTQAIHPPPARKARSTSLN